MPSEPVDQRYHDLVMFALNYGVENVRDSGEVLVPFVISETADGTRKLDRFVVGDPMDIRASAEKAVAFLAELEPSKRGAAAYDGYTTYEGKRTDAILVVARDIGSKEPTMYAQCYAPTKLLRPFKTIGAPINIRAKNT